MNRLGLAARLRRLNPRRGQMYMESLMPITVIFALLFVAALIFSLYSNALRGQNAMTRTAAYVSATGAWTAQQRLDCLRLLPGYDRDRPADDQPTAECRVYAQDGSGTWQQLPAICGTATANVGDCFNTPSTGSQRFIDYNKPMRVEISYRQILPRLCLFGACAGGDDQNATRSVQFYSQTRRTVNG